MIDIYLEHWRRTVVRLFVVLPGRLGDDERTKSATSTCHHAHHRVAVVVVVVVVVAFSGNEVDRRRRMAEHDVAGFGSGLRVVATSAILLNYEVT